MTCELPELPVLAYVQPRDPDANPGNALEEIKGILEDSIVNQPRSLQKIIGPSEIGNPCDHCIAAKLAGWKKQEYGIPWASTIGTGGHLLFETFFNRYEAAHSGRRHRFLTEAPVMVGRIQGREIWGSTDLLDTVTGMTVDWKFVGEASLKKYRQGPSQQYRVQAHLYAKGWNDAGIPVKHVSIYFLPRTRSRMSEGFWWTEPYNPEIAWKALARVNRIAFNVELEGEVGDQYEYITSLPRAEGCWDCKKYADYKPKIDTYQGIDLNL